MKRKKIIVVIVVIIFIIILSTITYQKYTVYLNKIKKAYSPYVITTKQINLYDKKKKKIGTIEKNFTLHLESKKNKYSKYFKIKNTNYYITYKNIKKTQNKTEEINKNYLPLNKIIHTNNNQIFYKNQKKLLKIFKPINLQIQYMDNDYYYVNYLNNILQIRKNKNNKIIEKKNISKDIANHISIIYYDEINYNCHNYNCINSKNLEEQLSLLKSNNYYTITIDELNNYLLGNISLRKNAVIILTKNKSKILDDLAKKYQIKININNLNLQFNNQPLSKISNKNNSNLNSYYIKNYTTIDNFSKMLEGQQIQEIEPPKAENIAVLNYHFFYDPSIGESCNESICLDIKKFKEHLNYLKDNNFKTLTMEEFKRWIYNEIELPKNSVLITIDDGAMGTGKHNGNKLIPTLEEYQMNATLFLITGWWDISNYQSSYLTIQSHTNDMHQYGTCGKGQMICYDKNQVKTDLQKSLEIIKNNDSFCFPFYSYNNSAIEAVQESGFKLAFIGGNKKATRTTNKYLIPRYPIQSYITIDQFKNMVN